MFHLMDILVMIWILISAFLGYKKGFVKSAINLVAFFVAIGLALMFYKPLAVILTENTKIDDWIIEGIVSNEIQGESSDKNSNENSDENKFNENTKTNLEDDESNLETESDLEDRESDFGTESNSKENYLMTLLENLPAQLFEQVKLEEIKENAKEEIAYQVSELIMNLLSLILIYIVVKITLAIATWVLDGIMQFPVLKQLNELLGLLFGGVMGILQIYVVFAVITFLSSICDITVVIDAIKVSVLAKVLFENNLIIYLLF